MIILVGTVLGGGLVRGLHEARNQSKLRALLAEELATFAGYQCLAVVCLMEMR